MTKQPRRTAPVLAAFATTALLALAAAVPSGAAGAAGAAAGQGGKRPAPTPQELAALRQSVHDVRNVGTAMFAWLTDRVAQRAGLNTPADLPPSDPERVDLTAVPVISAADLTKLLVPKYIAAIPELDPWGRPYEYRLNTQDPYARSVMALRTAGRDGKSEGSVYRIAGFPADDLDQDLVWIDGFFARWPQL